MISNDDIISDAANPPTAISLPKSLPEFLNHINTTSKQIKTHGGRRQSFFLRQTNFLCRFE